LNKVGHQCLTSKILCSNIYTKMSFNHSFKIICTSEVVKHLRILLFCPILYIIPFFKVKGYAFLANFHFWTRFKVFDI
jgi:hypothetical protein